MVDIKTLEAQLHLYCNRVKQNLNGSRLQTKRLVLDALDVQVIAINDKVEIKVYLPFGVNADKLKLTN